MRLRLAPLAALVLVALARPAWSLDLVQTWRAAAAHDPEFAAAQAAHDAGSARRNQASALWHPNVELQAGAGVASNETSTTGARFSAPGFGESNGVAFDTSIRNGTSTQYNLVLRQPLLSGERTAQQRQLEAAGAAADAAWRAAQQDLILRSAQRFFDAAVAAQQLRLLERQSAAVEKARVEAQDRFRIGDRPVTDVHEATARASALRAQQIAAASDLQARRQMLADLIGAQPPGELPVPAGTPDLPPLGDVDTWLDRAAQANPQVLLAEAGLRSAEQEAAKTASAVSPSLDLVAQVGRDHLSGNGDFGAASNTASRHAIGVQLTLPLFDSGRSSRHQETAALLEQRSAELDRARQQARQQARTAWLALSSAASRTQALEDGLKASLARLDATRVGQQAGDRTTLDVLNAENDAAAAELALLQARVGMLTQRLQLAATAGSLDENELAAANRALAQAGVR